jgi:hypothetical protein
VRIRRDASSQDAITRRGGGTAVSIGSETAGPGGVNAAPAAGGAALGTAGGAAPAAGGAALGTALWALAFVPTVCATSNALATEKTRII